MTRRYAARPLIVIGAVMVLTLTVVLSFSLGGNAQEEPPADPGTLTHIARKNDAAAMNAAMQMREESRRRAEAADATADFNDAMRER